jgi:hypothetical protein
MSMITWLRQGTAATLLVGPFVDDTDGKTAETALGLGGGDFLVWKKGGTTPAAKADAAGGTHTVLGYYTTTLDATDTATLGELAVIVHKAGALPHRQDYLVMAQLIYDALVSPADTTHRLPVDIVRINSNTPTVNKFERSASSITLGTSDNSVYTATNTDFDTDITEATPNHFKGSVIAFTSGALAGQRTVCEAYALTAGKGRFTVTALTEAVPNGTTFTVS